MKYYTRKLYQVTGPSGTPNLTNIPTEAILESFQGNTMKSVVEITPKPVINLRLQANAGLDFVSAKNHATMKTVAVSGQATTVNRGATTVGNVQVTFGNGTENEKKPYDIDKQLNITNEEISSEIGLTMSGAYRSDTRLVEGDNQIGFQAEGYINAGIDSNFNNKTIITPTNITQIQQFNKQDGIAKEMGVAVGATTTFNIDTKKGSVYLSPTSKIIVTRDSPIEGQNITAFNDTNNGLTVQKTLTYKDAETKVGIGIGAIVGNKKIPAISTLTDPHVIAGDRAEGDWSAGIHANFVGKHSNVGVSGAYNISKNFAIKGYVGTDKANIGVVAKF